MRHSIRAVSPRTTHIASDDEFALAISNEITHIVEELLSETGHNLTSFADAIGYSRVRVSQVMNRKEKSYLWRLPMICAVSRVFQVPVPDLIRRACGDPGITMHDILVRASDATPPGSPERLRWFISHVLQTYSLMYDKPEYDPDRNGDYELKFRCTPMEIEQGASEFYEGYSSGRIKDSSIPSRIWAAVSYADENGGLTVMPLWVALRKTCSE